MNDVTRRGSRDYDPFDRENLKAYMLRSCVGETNAIGERDLAAILGIEGRTIRSIVRDLELDGELCVGGGDEGMFIATYQEDVEAKNRRDRAAAESLLERVRARSRCASHLPRKQEFLF